MSKELEEALGRAFKIAVKNCTISDGVIIGVDEAETKFVVDVKIGQSIHYSVPLKVLKGKRAGVIEIPAINSACLLSFRDANAGRPQILFIDDVAKFFVNCESTIFNEGELGGMVKVEPLTEKINAIEDQINDLKNLFSAWAPVPTDGGAALKTIISNWASQPMQPTERNQIEDENVRH